MIKNKSFLGIRNLTKLRVMIIVGIFAAISIVLGKFLAVSIGETLRFSFENTTIILSGMLFGPAVGAVTGIIADLLGCLLRGYAINPIITFGAAVIGFLGGTFAYRKKGFFNIFLSVLLPHILGSVIIKTLGLHIILGYPFWITLFQRSLNYTIIIAAEVVLLYLLFKNKSFVRQAQEFLR